MAARPELLVDAVFHGGFEARERLCLRALTPADADAHTLRGDDELKSAWSILLEREPSVPLEHKHDGRADLGPRHPAAESALRTARERPDDESDQEFFTLHEGNRLSDSMLRSARDVRVGIRTTCKTRHLHPAIG
jgi:hypothetical protein